jgi:conjugal transfer pilin signal peptidase TrbI
MWRPCTLFAKKLSITLFAGIVTAALLWLISGRYGIAFGDQGCLPYKVFSVEKGVMPKKGEYVYFRGTNVPFYGDKVRLIKFVAGAAGDRIEVVPVEGESEIFEIDGEKRTFWKKARLYLHEGGATHEYPVFTHRTDGRPLSFAFEGQKEVALRGYFVVGFNPRSYDSRYWGTIDESVVIGRARPLF